MDSLGLRTVDNAAEIFEAAFANPLQAAEVSDDALLDILAVAEGLDQAKVVVAAGLDRAEKQGGGRD